MTDYPKTWAGAMLRHAILNGREERLDEAHGSPYDRGAADSWYRRGRNPHMYTGGTSFSPRISEANMTAAEIEAYHRGYDDNERSGGHKEF